jgi:putative spermidine/putrescine transport system substrate-binding protein
MMPAPVQGGGEDKGMTMRNGIAAALAAGMVAVVAGPAMAQSSQVQSTQVQGSMTLMAYSGVFQDNYTATVVQPFQQQRGVTVQFTAPGTSAQMLGAIRAQKGDAQTDVVIMDVTTAQIACAEGLVEKLTPAEVPVLPQIAQLAREAGGDCGPGVTFDHMVMVYDTKAITTPPTSLEAMAAASARGKVGIDAPPNILGLAMTAAIANKAGGNWRAIDAAMPLLKRIAANTQTFQPQPDPYATILNDQLHFAIGWNARGQYYHDQSKGRVGVVLPEEGAVFQINTINLVAGSKNRAAALAFINHALSAQPQAAFTERMFYAPTNTTAQVAPAALERTAMAPQYRSRVVPVDWSEMVKIRDSWNQRWRREVITAAPR